MKKLIIITHPQMASSQINRSWKEELLRYPDLFTVHDLHHSYPDSQIDVAREQQLVEAHELIVFQYPLYWFNCPPLLKQWLDEVLLHGWAYGAKGNKMKGKKIALAISVGAAEDEYREGGLHGGTLAQLCLPFQMTAQYIDAQLTAIFTWYDVEHQPSPEIIAQSTRAYIDFARALE
ncbi:NAD(P)H-dependent oxidoreductase [Flavobacterium sp. JP2137]|uniref:NAD(P)H-dependent oxidoreductase n=1 Tax=Flavobacterium sp. JP2137 TaxID=3414510 RepID=UPI003D2FD212